MRGVVLIAAAIGIAGFLLYAPGAQKAQAQQDVENIVSPPAKHKPRPANIHGCWTGPLTDDNDFTGSVSFKILQSKTKIVNDSGHNHGSRIDIEYDVGGYANGPISGTINGTAIKFSAFFGGTCRGTSVATLIVTPKEIKGSFDYSQCPSGLVHLIYDVKPTTCSK